MKELGEERERRAWNRIRDQTGIKDLGLRALRVRPQGKSLRLLSLPVIIVGKLRQASLSCLREDKH